MIAGVTSTWECPLLCVCVWGGFEHCHPGETDASMLCGKTAWKSASVNTPRPHVLPGQRGLASLQAHLHTILQLLASQPRRQSREGRGGVGGWGESSQTKRTCFFCDAGVSDESDDIWEEQWKAACRGRITGIHSLYATFIKTSACEGWPPSSQVYICITPLCPRAKVCLAAIVTQPAHILERRWIAA